VTTSIRPIHWGAPGRWAHPASPRAVEEPRSAIGRLAIGLALVSAMLTVLARATHLSQSWEVHVDEISYLRLSQSVAEHLSVQLYGQPFYLHPPAYFFVEGAFLKLWQPGGDLIAQIYAARSVNVALAGFTAALLVVLGWRIGGWRAAVGAGFLFALDPFVVRMNSRTFLETSAVFWVVAGFAVLILPTDGPRLRPRALQIVGSGVLFGLALLTKDMTAFVTLLPLGVCWVLGWCLTRRSALLVGSVAVLTYLPYPVLVWLSGDGPAFAAGKLGGLARLTGVVKITGFRSGGPSFLQAVIANLDQFGTTYALIALGGIALLILLRSPSPDRRLVGIWTACAYVLVVYCAGFGTLEEQFFYYLVVPIMLALSAAAAQLWSSHRLGTAIRVAELTLAGLFVVWTGFLWTRAHFTPDNGYERVRAYLLANVAQRVPIGATTEPAEFLLDEYTTGLWSSIDALRAHRAEYVLISTRQVATGYAIGSPEMFAWLRDSGQVVFSFQGPTNGTLQLVRLPAGWWSAPSNGDATSAGADTTGR